MYSKKLALLLAVWTALALSGCASFRNNEIAEIDKLPDVSRYANKPSVFVETHFFRGEPGNATIEILTLKEKLNASVDRTLRDSSLFSTYSLDEKDRANADYVIRLDIYNHGNHGLAALAGFISGLTMTVIPAAATDNYTVEANMTKRAPSGARSSCAPCRCRAYKPSDISASDWRRTPPCSFRKTRIR